MSKVIPLISYALQSKGPVLSGLMLDNGVALLASYLKQSGYSPIIYDFNNLKSIKRIDEIGKEKFVGEVIDQLDEFVKKNGVELIGFKLFSNGFKDSIEIAHQLRKKNPELKIVGGGPQVGWFGEHIFKYIDNNYNVEIFNGLISGEADSCIKMIADGVSFSEIPGMIYKETNSIIQTNQRAFYNLSELPFPIYDVEIYLEIEVNCEVITIRRSLKAHTTPAHIYIGTIKEVFANSVTGPSIEG